MKSGRFEWISIPRKDTETVIVPEQVAEGRVCSGCGWVDTDDRYLAGSGVAGIKKCPRCDYRWGIADEIQRFFENEQIAIPDPVITWQDRRYATYYQSVQDKAGIFRLRIQAEEKTLRKGYDALLALTLSTIDRFDHQIKAAGRVLNEMRGRALLADEVGMGKTVEAGLIIKELVLRGVGRQILILAPSGLLEQWQGELAEKFHETFEVLRGKNPGKDQFRLIVSYDTAKRRPALLHRKWDLVVFDEAHRLKNRSTQLYKYARQLSGRMMLAISATPIQNSINELYSLVDLIDPGRLGTIRGFRRSFVQRGDSTEIIPGREAALKDLLADIMIRNRRDTCTVKFQRRRVGIYHITPTPEEESLYQAVTGYVKAEFKAEYHRETGMNTRMLNLIVLQRLLMSMPQAVARTLRKIAGREKYTAVTKRKLDGFAEAAEAIETPSKITALKEILSSFSDNRFIIFTEFVESMKGIGRRLNEMGIPVMYIRGGQSPAGRRSAIETFRDTPGAVLVSTEAGSVGLNLQFCNALVNWDLPWNPMKLEQRIGRIDRIGQRNEALVFNLVCTGTIEEHVVDILANKLRLFELVVGEMGEVLGNLEQGMSFEHLIADIWLASETREERHRKEMRVIEVADTARQRHDRGKRASAVLDTIV